MSRGREQLVVQFSFSLSTFQPRIGSAPVGFGIIMSEVAFSFVCRVVGGEARQAWEAIDATYFAVEEVSETSNGRHVEIARDALNRRAGLCSGALIEQDLI